MHKKLGVLPNADGLQCLWLADNIVRQTKNLRAARFLTSGLLLCSQCCQLCMYICIKLLPNSNTFKVINLYMVGQDANADQHKNGCNAWHPTNPDWHEQ